MDVIDDLSNTSMIFAELASEPRLQMLIRLNQQKLRLVELAKGLDITAQETHRNVSRLIEIGLVEKDHESFFSLTTFGKSVLEQIPTFAFLAEHKLYFEQHTLGDLPPRLIRNIGALYKAEVIHGVFNVHNKWKQIFRDANEYIRAVKSQVSLEMIGAVAEAIKSGVKYSYILGQDVIVEKGRSELQRKLGWRDLMSQGLIERKMAEKVHVVTILNESKASVLFPDLKGKADLNTMFYSDDPSFHEWCLDYFRYKWDSSGIFDDSKVKEI